jgi:hypothetical protein
LGNAIGRRRSVINMSPERPASWQGSEVRAVQRRLAAVDIAAEDWDLLFRAVLDLLARASKANPATESTSVQLNGPPGAALHECLDALDQLRRSVPSEGPQPLRVSARG